MTEFNWPQLLKWSSKYIDESASQPHFESIVPERLEFFQGAIREAMKNIVDPNQIIEESKKELFSFDDKAVLSSLIEIDNCIELPGCSLDLEKLGLIQPLLESLSRSEEIRCLVYQIFSKSVQNNLPAQKIIGCSDAFSVILKRVKHENSEEAMSRGITAISSLIRHNRELEESFVSGELNQIEIWLNSDSIRVREKTLSLLRHLLSERIIGKHESKNIKNSNVFEIILKLIGENSQRNSEHINIQYSEILSDTLLQLIQVNSSQITNNLGIKLIEQINDRVDFLSEYSRHFPEDDISPERAILVKCMSLVS
ncbi:Hsp70 nucleotide exchange factor FES1 [Cryptosporidium felis]|nr:Hsp70 nucleotide exchange factor FES1 [Cryptosporidium felis]